MKAVLAKYALNLLVAVDQFVNTVLAGDPDETISSRAAKSRLWHWRLIGAMLEWLDPGHLQRTIEIDEGRSALWAVAPEGRIEVAPEERAADENPDRPA